MGQYVYSYNRATNSYSEVEIEAGQHTIYNSLGEQSFSGGFSVGFVTTMNSKIPISNLAVDSPAIGWSFTITDVVDTALANVEIPVNDGHGNVDVFVSTTGRGQLFTALSQSGQTYSTFILTEGGFQNGVHRGAYRIGTGGFRNVDLDHYRAFYQIGLGFGNMLDISRYSSYGYAYLCFTSPAFEPTISGIIITSIMSSEVLEEYFVDRIDVPNWVKNLEETESENPYNPGTPGLNGNEYGDSNNNPYIPSGGSTPVVTPGVGTDTGLNDSGSGTLENDSVPTGNSTGGHAIIDSTNAGLFRSYAMTVSQVQTLGSYLWSSNVVDTVVKYLDNPLDVIISLIEYPFQITPAGSNQNIVFSWLPTPTSNQPNGQPLTSEYQTLDFGSISIARYSGLYYDFQPFSTAQLYLPYIGYVPLKMNEIVGNSLSVVYNVLLTSGGFSAHVSSGGKVIGVYNGMIGRQLPLASRDFSRMYASIAKTGAIAATAIVGGFAVGGAAGAATASASTATSVAKNTINQYGLGTINADIAIQQAGEAVETAKQANSALARNVHNGFKDFGQSALSAVANANAPIQRSGSVDPISGRTMPQVPFIIISIPHQNLPANYQLLGYSTNAGGKVSNFSGYTEFRAFRVSPSGATLEERNEIEQLMAGGIII